MRDLQSRILNSNKRMYPGFTHWRRSTRECAQCPHAQLSQLQTWREGESSSQRMDGWYVGIISWSSSLHMFFSNRSPPARHTGWPWPNWDVTMSEWWLWMSTPKIPPTLKSLKMSIPTRFIECYSAEQNMVGNYEIPSWWYFKKQNGKYYLLVNLTKNLPWLCWIPGWKKKTYFPYWYFNIKGIVHKSKSAMG